MPATRKADTSANVSLSAGGRERETYGHLRHHYVLKKLTGADLPGQLFSSTQIRIRRWFHWRSEPASKRRAVRKLIFVTWADVAHVCQGITRSQRKRVKDPVGTIVAQEFFIHLQEYHMTDEPRPEIYLRDVSTLDSVKLFFRHHIYKCQPSYYNSARRTLRPLFYASYSESSARGEFGSLGGRHFFYRANPEGSAREQEGGACMPKSRKASKLRGGDQVDSGTPPGGRSSSYNPRRTAPLIRLPNHESQTAQGRGKFHQRSHGLPILLIRSPSRSISIAREW